jgi:hypothetical protein
MNTLITFVIPVRHQSNSKNWGLLKANLTQTIASISAQTNSNWRAVIVANQGADLPAVPERFQIVRVNFTPNEMYEQQGHDKEEFYDAVRLDKGRRILKGMLYVRDTAFYMVVDDDDFVSNSLVSYVSKNQKANGWKISEGYVWGDGGSLLYVHRDFANFCGTSLIIRSDLFCLPDSFEVASSEYIKTMLGSHIKIVKILTDKGAPLASLPFRGAIYRVGHVGAHSKSPTLIKMYLLNRSIMLSPLRFVRNLLSMRLVSSDIKNKYFGQ